jgi:hypothetical protein
MTIAALPERFRAKATELEPYAPAAAVAWRAAATELEAALIAHESELLTYRQAATESGFSADHLRHLRASGTIPDCGVRAMIRRGDLPRNPKKQRDRSAQATTGAAYDAAADALDISSRRLVRKLERAE